jgi:hypothetical protein
MRPIRLRPKLSAALLATLALFTLGAANVNPYWYVVAWCIDNGNVSGCASDGNDGRVCSCGIGNHGPLKTWSQLYENLWGCGAGGQCPRWVAGFNLVNASVTFWSDDTAETINFDMATAHGFTGLVFRGLPGQGGSTTIGSGVLSNFTAKPTDRKTGVTNTRASGLYKAAIAGVTLGPNELVFDSTNPSYFWPYYDITTAGGTPGVGDTWAFSQPMLGGYDSFASQLPAEVTIASGDSVTVYRPQRILVNKAHAEIYAAGGGNNPAPNVVFEDLLVGNNTIDTVNANNGISFNAVALESNLQIVPGSNGISYMLNVSAPSVAADFNNSTAGFGGQQNLILAGLYGTPIAPAQDCVTCVGCSVDYDTIFGQEPGFYASSISNFSGNTYVESGSSILVYPGSTLQFSPVAVASGSAPHYWGPGGLIAFSGGNIQYPAGAGKAASTFLQVSNISLWTGGAASYVCFVDPTAGTGVLTCNLLPLTSTLDSTLGSRTGCLFAPGGGGICN